MFQEGLFYIAWNKLAKRGKTPFIISFLIGDQY